MEVEIWKDIPGYESYQVSSLGRIRTTGRMIRNTMKSERFVQAKILKPMNNGRWYLAASIQIRKKKKNIYIHRLVAQLFIPNPDGLPEVNHIDGNKSNNALENLEWVTNQGNRDHAKRTGLICRGERSAQAKLTTLDVLNIRMELRLNKSVNKSELGRKYNVKPTTITKIEKRQRWSHLPDPE